MKTPPETRPAGLAPLPSAVLGATLVLGWSCFDLTVFLTSAHIPTILRLLPSMLVAVLAGGVLGGLLSAHRRLPSAALVLAFLATLGTALPTKLLAVQYNWFIRIVCVLLILHWISAQLYRRWDFSVVRSGLTLGFLASLALALFQDVPSRVAWAVAGTAAVLAWGSGWLAPGAKRWGLTALALLGALLGVAYNISLFSLYGRPDSSALSEHAARARDEARPSLILIVIDTLRADHLSCYGYSRETSPILDAFAAESATRYTHARSTSSWTLPAHASLMTGLFPAQHGATATRGEPDARTNALHSWPCQAIDKSAPMLAEALYERGYQTGAVVGNSFNVSANMGFGRGFMHFDDQHGSFTRGHKALVQLAGWNMALGGLAYRDARAVTDNALTWLEGVEDQQPFLLFLNYMDPHDPYLPSDDVRSAFSDYQPADPFKPTAEEIPLLYDREILAVDRQIGRLFAELRERDAFDKALIVVTSDHGEGLGEHGNAFHSWSLYEELLHVPLLIKLPGSSSGAVSDEAINLIGVHDLIAGVLGVEIEPREPVTHIAEWYRGLWNESEVLRAREARMGQPLDRDLIAWLDGHIKFIVGSNDHVEAYDLEQDPGESTPLALSEAELDAARARAAAWWEAHPPPVAIERELGEDEAARLRLLGYIDEADE